MEWLHIFHECFALSWKCASVKTRIIFRQAHFCSKPVPLFKMTLGFWSCFNLKNSQNMLEWDQGAAEGQINGHLLRIWHLP